MKDNTDHASRRKPRLRLVTPPKSRPEEAGDATVRTPAGFREGDEITSVEFTDHTHAPEFYGGDIAVLFHTADVLPDDLAAVEIDGGAWFGVYRPAPRSRLLEYWLKAVYAARSRPLATLSAC